MKFGPVPLAEAEGKILGHNVADDAGKRRLRKGKPLRAEDVSVLRELGRSMVYVAELEPGDVDENTAANRVAHLCLGRGLRLSGAAAGRINLIATVLGLVRIDVGQLRRLNEGEGLTVASLGQHAVVRPGQTVATVKVIPYAVPESVVAALIGQAGRPLLPSLNVDELASKRVGLILSGSPSVRGPLSESFFPLVERVRALGSDVVEQDYVDVGVESGEQALAEALERQRDMGVEVILFAGETAVMDRHDITPRAVERAGGRVEVVGAPVDPGNLLMLAYLNDIPILGAPGCARSRKMNVIDWVLPRLLAGDRLTREDIIKLGPGGLLEDVPERPLPRSRIES